MLTRAVVLAAEALGASRAALLAAVGLSDEDLAAYDLRVARDNAVALWDAIEAWSNEPLIAARIAQQIARSGGAALFQYTVRAAPTVEAAWARLLPMLGLFFGDGFESVTRAVDGHWELGYRLPLHGDGPVPRSEECVVVGFVEQCRAVAPGFAPAALCFQHEAGAPLADWRREVGCPVEFGASYYGVRIGERAYRAAIPGHDPSLARLLEGLARPIVEARAEVPGPAEPAARVIRALLERGEPATLDAIARALHVSRRTLQRQLAAAGTSVRGELDRARHEAALVLLRDVRSTVAEIAARLGFADPSQFTRAVRRWTGAAPTELRFRARH